MIAQPETIQEAIRATEAILNSPPPALQPSLRLGGKHSGIKAGDVMTEWADGTRKRLRALRCLLAAVERAAA